MPHNKLIPALAMAVAVAVAGCGSASSSSQSAAGGASPYGGASAYGAASSSTASAASVALITTKHSTKLGTILAYGHKDLTVYLFESDHGAKSSCTGTCATVWPPVTGKPQAAGGALQGDLGTVRRPDGTMQVTYKGHPLYRFAKDGDDHDAYGQGLRSFGAPWYALAPSGAKVDKS